MKYLVFLCTFSFAVQQYSYSFELEPGSGGGESCGASGRLIAPPDVLTNAVTIELVGRDNPTRQKVLLSAGSFEFQPVPAGPYQFRVLNGSGQILIKTTKQLNGERDYVLLRSRLSAWEQASENTVSLQKLGHEVPKKAMKLEREGENAAECGEVAKSILLFEKALAVDPRFTDAELQLAVSYARMGKESSALEHAQAAYDLDSESLDAGQTLTMLFIHAKRYREAENIVKCLLRSHSGLPELHALLAVGIIGSGGNLEEAYEHIKIAAKDFPLARLLAANTLAERGFVSRATDQLRAFISSSTSECERSKFQNWIKNNTNASLTSSLSTRQ